MGIEVIVNGRREGLEDGLNVAQFLRLKNVRPELVAVELNGILLSRDQYETRLLAEGDVLEFLHYMAGGAAREGQDIVTLRVQLTFPMERVKEPLIYNLGHKFDVVTNIRRANVEQSGGWVVLEITGPQAEIEKGFEYLRSFGVAVDPVEKDVVEG